MALSISTFDNRSGGGSAFFKAVGHPLVDAPARALVDKIRAGTRVIAYDPQDTLSAFASIYPVTADNFAAILAQDVSRFSRPTLGAAVAPVTELENLADADLLFIPIFDAQRTREQIAHIIPDGCEVLTLDEMRLPDRFLADTRRYLNPINFATNLLFFRDDGQSHTRLVTANYWSAYGAKAPFLWGRLFAADGTALLDFEQPLGGAHELVELDSAALRRAHPDLPDFCGQVFIHIAGAAGHDIVKYVVDAYGGLDGDEPQFSCTHDANSWPADLYAGVPAPAPDERVVLWVQNSHPAAIPAGAVRVARMGTGDFAAYPHEIPPYATCAVDMGELLPDVRWPAQLEIDAGKHFVRPRYEVLGGNRRRINHANVERTDLSIDDELPNLPQWFGKGYVLPAPILPRRDFVSECLPTPMSTAQQNLPYTAVAYDKNGAQVARRFLGCLPRAHSELLSLSELASALPDNEPGHVELLYDFTDGGGGDGWMHSLFRYTEKSSAQGAETSFGAHIFNHLVTYKSEPQSYKGPPPGLTTRLFLRIADAPVRTFCHLIYTVSRRWHPHSETHLELKNRQGEMIAETLVRIPAGGSFLFYCDEQFDEAALRQAGAGAYIIVRDPGCRLFGYHGVRLSGAFALDHMFGF